MTNRIVAFHLPHCAVGLALALALCLPLDSVGAQKLSVIETIRFDGDAADLSAVSFITSSPLGYVAIGQRQDGHVRVFLAGKPYARIGRTGQGPGEFGMLSAYAGWIGDTLWVVDFGARRTQLFTPRGELLSGFRHPQGPAVDANLPGFDQPDVVAVAPDLTTTYLAVTGGRKQNSRWEEPTRNKGGVLVQGALASGPTRFVVGVIPVECRVVINNQRTGPFLCPRQLMKVASDGSRIALVNQDVRADGRATLTIRVLSPTGATMWKRTDTVTAERVSAAARDSIRNACVTNAGSPASAELCRLRPFAHGFPVARSVVVNANGELWVQLRVPGSARRKWQIYGPTGMIKGWFELGGNVTIETATGRVFWAVETDDDGSEDVVQFKLRDARQ